MMRATKRVDAPACRFFKLLYIFNMMFYVFKDSNVSDSDETTFVLANPVNY